MPARLTGKAARAFKGQAFLKFAATLSPEGVPNVVPLLSARMINPETIAFVRFMVWKTARNFEANKKITFACTGPWARAYLAKGEFRQWQEHGPILEQFENEPIYRYNAYAGANVIGLVRVREVLAFAGNSIAGPLLASLFQRLAGRGPRALAQASAAAAGNGPMPPQVMEKWNRTLAVKFIAMADEQGDPLAFPLQGLAAPEPGILTFPLPKSKDHPLGRIKPGQVLAAAVLAADPSAYQVKGRFAGEKKRHGKRVGVIEVSEVYAAAPPLPGKRIYPPE